MMKSQQSDTSLTTKSNVFRLFGFVGAVACVAVGAGAMAVGLIVPSWDIFKLSPKVPAPAKALASTTGPSSINSVSVSAAVPKGVELIVRTDAPLQHGNAPTLSTLDRMPAASLQDAESKANDDHLPDLNVPTAPPAIVTQEPRVNSAIDTKSQEPDTPVVTSGIAAASSPSPPEAEPNLPTATSPRDSHPMQSVQTIAATAPAHKPRSRGGPTIEQRMWYK